MVYFNLNFWWGIWSQRWQLEDSTLKFLMGNLEPEMAVGREGLVGLYLKIFDGEPKARNGSTGGTLPQNV